MSTHARKRHMRRIVISMLAILVLAATGLQAAGETEGAFWKARIENAAPGSTIILPAGRLEMADVTLPAGVKVHGAGYQRTIIDAAKGLNGLQIAQGCEIRGLTVRKAPSTGLLVKDAAGVLVSGVRVEQCLSGVVANNAPRLRVENSILYANRMGMAVANAPGACVVNNTFFNNSSLGLSVTGTRDAAVFNNIIANSATGVYLAENTSVRLDYNLYLANYIGKIPGHPGTISVQGWRGLAEQDMHSLQAVVTFANPDEGIFAPSTRLSWAPGRSPVMGFGTVKFGAFTAPATDLFGNARTNGVDIGAVQEAPSAPVLPAAGTFTVTQEDATVSAGLYTPSGVLVSTLFQNLPLRKGKYAFWLPARDWQGRPILPGAYEVRTAESKARMAYKGLVFNNARSSDTKDHSPMHVQYADFTPDGRVILGNGWSESHLQVRTFDANYDKAGWVVKGSSTLQGMGLDAEDHLYLLKYVGKEKDSGKLSLELVRIGLTDGVVQAITPEAPAPLFTGIFSDKADGLAELHGRLYVSDPAAGRLFHAPAARPTFTDSIPLDAPRQVAADRMHGVLWLISKTSTLLAVAPDGTIRHTQEFPHSLDKLAVSNGRLALLSRETGKIHIYTIESPQKLVPVRTVGTGEYPFGKFAPNKFTFKGSGMPCALAINASGDLFVFDWPRTLYFAADGTLKKQTIAVWGQHLVSGRLAGDTQPRWWNVDSSYSITMDSKNGTWAPDSYWSYADPSLMRFRSAVDFFSDQGRNFALFRHGGWQAPTVTLVEFDQQCHGRSIISWQSESGPKRRLLEKTDTSGDGIINAKDEPGQALTTPDGQPVTLQFGDYWYLDPNNHDVLVAGALFGPASIGLRIRYRGIDARGIPCFDWAGAQAITSKMDAAGAATFTSPFDHKTAEKINSLVGEFTTFSDGTVAFSTSTKSGGGTGYGHVAGSDMAAAGPDGAFRWFYPLPLTGGVHGVQVVNDILITQDFTDMDWYLINRDGLGLGISGVPQQMRWTGMWNDHPKQYRLFKGNDGEAYAVLGDYVLTAFHQFKVEGAGTIRTQRLPVTVSEAVAQALMARPPQPVPARVEPPTFTATIKKLEAPLTVDGDLKKWRATGITPQIIITPETAGGDVTGPADISSVVRLAHENGNLYVQVIKFDDIVTMHQPLLKHYMQDSVEFCINSFLHGFKYNVTRTQEHGDTVFRDRFFETKYNRVYTPEDVPRSIRMLDSAADVEERKLIESIYGVDLSNCRVIVTEFKLPLAKAFEGDPKAGPSGKSGDTMWIGFMLDDNDVPGSDTQDLLVYPATYSTFALKERGCLATFE